MTVEFDNKNKEDTGQNYAEDILFKNNFSCGNCCNSCPFLSERMYYKSNEDFFESDSEKFSGKNPFHRAKISRGIRRINS